MLMSRFKQIPRIFFRTGAMIVTLVIVSLVGVHAKPYDMLYYTNGNVEPCVLINVTQDSIRYRLADQSEGSIQYAARKNVALIFRNTGEFLLASQPDATWKIGNNPDFHTIVTFDGQLFPASNIQEYEDIIFYQNAVDSTDASVRVAETIAIIYQDGSHKMLANANEVALGLSRAVEFTTLPDPITDAVASTESVAAPLANSTTTVADTTEATVEDVSADTLKVKNEADNTKTVAAVPDSTERAAAPLLRVSDEVTSALELNNTNYKEYAAKALNKAEYLGYYLDLLCDRTLDIYDKDQAIENALKLFVHDSTLVQVSSVTRDRTSAYKIKNYLKRLSLLNYDKVELVWRDVQYVTKFRLAADGRYYGAITVEQLFRGFKDGRPIYEDVTRKDVEIVLGKFRREESGATEYAWDVLLSNIGVEETRRR